MTTYSTQKDYTVTKLFSKFTFICRQFKNYTTNKDKLQYSILILSKVRTEYDLQISTKKTKMTAF